MLYHFKWAKQNHKYSELLYIKIFLYNISPLKHTCSWHDKLIVLQWIIVIKNSEGTTGSDFVYYNNKTKFCLFKDKTKFIVKTKFIQNNWKKKLLSTFYIVLTLYCFAPDSTLVILLKFLFRDSHIFFPYVQCQIKEVAWNV